MEGLDRETDREVAAMPLDPHTEDQLEEMLNTLRDGVRGYNAAVGAVEDRGIVAELRELRAAREQMFAELAEVVVPHGISVEQSDDGTLGGALHRLWLRMPTALTAGDAAILDVVEEGEQGAVEVFERGLAADVPADVLELAERHLDGLRLALSKTQSLIRSTRDVRIA